MASKKFSFLEQSTRECSTESAQSYGSTANGKTEPSAVHFYLPDDSSTESNDGASTKLLSSSHARYSAIGVPVPANGQSIAPQESREAIVDSGSTNRFYTFWEWYKNAAIDFRQTHFIYFIYYLFSYIPISAMIMGLVFLNECPQSSSLPILVTAVGTIGTIFVAFGIAVSYCEHSGAPCCNFCKFILGILFASLLFGLLVEMYLVSNLTPNFDSSQRDYCSKAFHHYLIGKEIMCASVLILLALIYFPGSCLHTCCQNCPVPSPAGAFFNLA